jgi:putative sterol carrier protein
MVAPDAEVVIHGKERPVNTTFGPDGVRPDLEIDMAADTLHRIFMGQLTLQKAFGSGQMRVRGPIWKAFALGDLFVTGQKCYPDVLKVQGLA